MEINENEVQNLRKQIRHLESKIDDLKIERMSYMELLDLNHEDSETDEDDLHELSSEIRQEIESDLIKEEKITNLGVKISRLHYEISEYFHMIRQGITSEKSDYERYKMEKRNLHKTIETFYTIYQGENKLDVFDILIKILRKQKKVYQCDQEMTQLL
jgi:hypothetical protein